MKSLAPAASRAMTPEDWAAEKEAISRAEFEQELKKFAL